MLSSNNNGINDHDMTAYHYFDAVVLLSVIAKTSVSNLPSQANHNFMRLLNSSFDARIGFDSETGSVLKIEQLSSMQLTTIAVYQHENKTIEPGIFIPTSNSQCYYPL